MSAISNDAAHDQKWRQLCQAALFEVDPVKLLERIASARSAVLDRIEDRFSTKSNGQSGGEERGLRDALAALTVLRTIAERQIRDRGTTA
jgi:hypothetical protein